MKKASVLLNGIHAGHLLDGLDVARVTRSGDVRLRHAWRDGTDARAWDAIRRAARVLARETAARRRCLVWVLDYYGSHLEIVGHTS